MTDGFGSFEVPRFFPIEKFVTESEFTIVVQRMIVGVAPMLEILILEIMGGVVDWASTCGTRARGGKTVMASNAHNAHTPTTIMCRRISPRIVFSYHCIKSSKRRFLAMRRSESRPWLTVTARQGSLRSRQTYSRRYILPSAELTAWQYTNKP